MKGRKEENESDSRKCPLPKPRNRSRSLQAEKANSRSNRRLSNREPAVWSLAFTSSQTRRLETYHVTPPLFSPTSTPRIKSNTAAGASSLLCHSDRNSSSHRRRTAVEDEARTRPRRRTSGCTGCIRCARSHAPRSTLLNKLIICVLAPFAVPSRFAGGCGSFYAISIAHSSFKGLTMMKQHRLVNGLLKDEIKEMHGLQVRFFLGQRMMMVARS